MTNLDTEPAPLPPPIPATPEPHDHRWARSDDRVVFGVAGGLGRALAIDPLIVRLAFVVLALFSGVGIVLYLAGLVLLANSPTSAPPSVVRKVLGAIAVLICARWLFGGNAHLPDAGWVVAVGLFGAAVALWRGRSPVTATPPPAEPLTDAPGGSTTERWASLTAQRRDRPRRPRSALGLLTIGTATVVGALVWLVNGTDVRPRHRCLRMGDRRSRRRPGGRQRGRARPMADRAGTGHSDGRRGRRPLIGFAGVGLTNRHGRPDRGRRRRQHGGRRVPHRVSAISSCG